MNILVHEYEKVKEFKFPLESGFGGKVFYVTMNDLISFMRKNHKEFFRFENEREFCLVALNKEKPLNIEHSIEGAILYQLLITMQNSKYDAFIINNLKK